LRFGVFFTTVAVRASAQVVVYECDTFPEIDSSWVRSPFCDPARWVADGLLHQHVEACPTGGEQKDTYTRNIGEFEGGAAMFFEWSNRSDGSPDQIIATCPSSMVFSNLTPSAVAYHYTIADSQVRFMRDDLTEIVFFDIAPGVMHTYRLEYFDDGAGQRSDIFYIDGQVVHSGAPGGPFPISNAVVQWRAKYNQTPSTTKWDYLRYGILPQAASGDFDSNGQVDDLDLYYFEECLGHSGPSVRAGPGCRWADFNADTDVDCNDWQSFRDAWTDTGDAPQLAACPLPIPVTSDWGFVILALLILSAATILFRRTAAVARPQTR